MQQNQQSRRRILAGGAAFGAGAVAWGARGLLLGTPPAAADLPPGHEGMHGGNMHGGGIDGPTFRGTVDHAANGFDPMQVLRDFDPGTVSTLPDGRTLREREFFASDEDIEVAPGVCAAVRGTGCGSPSPTAPRTRTRCTSTASTPPRWTASPRSAAA